MKKKVSVEIEDSLLKWVEEQIEKGDFDSLSQAFESSILYRKKRFSKRRKTKKVCVMCEKRFLRGWNPPFDKDHGFCQKCLDDLLNEDYMKDMTEQEREQELIGIFEDSE